MRIQHQLLTAMGFFYLIPILTVYSMYQTDTPSISCIICSDSIRTILLLSMTAMAVCTLFYERNRKDPISFVTIVLLLIGIGGVIMVKESSVIIHYSFAVLVFLSIILFLYHHSKRLQNQWLYGLVLAELVLIMHTIYCLQTPSIFLSEALLLGIFAVGYVSIHWIEYKPFS